VAKLAGDETDLVKRAVESLWMADRRSAKRIIRSCREPGDVF
jgi:hypothetical protein